MLSKQSYTMDIEAVETGLSGCFTAKAWQFAMKKWTGEYVRILGKGMGWI